MTEVPSSIDADIRSKCFYTAVQKMDRMTKALMTEPLSRIGENARKENVKMKQEDTGAIMFAHR